MDELGQVVATHRANTDRRAAIGGRGLALGVLALVIAVNLVGEVDDTSTSRQALGGVIGLALSAFAIGGWPLAKRALLPGERFVVHERGLAHVTDRRDVVVPWRRSCTPGSRSGTCTARSRTTSAASAGWR